MKTYCVCGQQRARVAPSAATLAVCPECHIKQYFLELMQEKKNVWKQERELLTGKTFKELLKELFIP